jgi:hypothetical protein
VVGDVATLGRLLSPQCTALQEVLFGASIAASLDPPRQDAEVPADAVAIDFLAQDEASLAFVLGEHVIFNATPVLIEADDASDRFIFVREGDGVWRMLNCEIIQYGD